MSELYNLISNIVKKELGSFNSIQTVPCRVIDVLNNGTVQVELVSTKARYIVANCSGSTVNIGETVQLYYRGIISNHTAYIGASFYKSGTTSNFVTMDSKVGLVGSDFSLVSSIRIKSLSDTNIEITYNATILGTDNCDIEFVVRIDGIEHSYKPTVSMVVASKFPICFSVPYDVKKGNHIVEIFAKGLSNIECAYGFISGQVDKGEIIFDDISATDFIFIDNTDTVDTALYTGDNLVVKIPNARDGKPVKIIRASTFNVSNVEAVHIPDGVTEIE